MRRWLIALIAVVVAGLVTLRVDAAMHIAGVILLDKQGRYVAAWNQ